MSNKCIVKLHHIPYTVALEAYMNGVIILKSMHLLFRCSPSFTTQHISLKVLNEVCGPLPLHYWVNLFTIVQINSLFGICIQADAK